MRVDVMQHYGFTQPLSHAGYYETAHHRQLMIDIKSAILEGHLIALCGVIGSQTVTRNASTQLKDENRVLVAKALAVKNIGSPWAPSPRSSMICPENPAHPAQSETRRALRA